MSTGLNFNGDEPEGMCHCNWGYQKLDTTGTRMHSSRMRTTPSFTVCHSIRLGGSVQTSETSNADADPPWVDAPQPRQTPPMDRILDTRL